MNYINCGNCEKTHIPINESIMVDCKVYCTDCINASFKSAKDLEGKLVVKDADPTICFSCGKDNGNIPLDTISVHPVCDACALKIRNKTFPNWVKVFFVAILVIVAFSFYWNWRFYASYRDLQEANHAFFEKGDIAKAEKLSKRASENVPEVEDIKTLHHYFSGYNFFAKAYYDTAITEFNECRDLPDNFQVTTLIMQSRIASSFIKKDYEHFLAIAKENLMNDTTLAMSWATVASADACLYITKGIDSLKTLAFRNIEKGKMIDSTGKEVKDYYNLIEYRLYNKEFISEVDFNKKYPEGWIKN